jgi:hypothetical protein
VSWQVVPDAEVPKVIAAVQEGRCVACYGPISRDCPIEHAFYCCECDDVDCT